MGASLDRFDRLYRIRGTPQQVTIEEAKNTAAPPPPAPDQQQKGAAIPPAEREAWGDMFRYFARYMPQLREAALLDDENARACEIFQAACTELAAFSRLGAIGRIIAPAVYELMGELYKEQQLKAKYGDDVSINPF